MTDYCGTELKVGDEVLFMAINYRTFAHGIISHMNLKKATIRWFEKSSYNNESKTMQFYNQLIKVPENRRTLKIIDDKLIRVEPVK
jgi:hypothetical protein